jgi:CPA2 family monovalent cation:H+ antiporter-2
MHGTGDLTGLALVMGAALLCGLGMRRLGQPPIVGYILAGVLLGPSGVALVGDRETVGFLAELGVLLLLFLVAMEMSLYAFREVWKVSAAATVLQIAIGVGLLAPFAWFGRLAWGEAAVLGFVIALSSTAVVIKMLEQTNILRQPVGQLVVGVLIAQDLAVVPLLIGVNFMALGAVSGWVALKFVAALVAVAALVWFLARRKRLVIPLIHENTPPELVALGGLAICFGGAALTGVAGLTPALGAFLAGLVIGNSTARHPMILSTRPIQGVLLMVFFLSVGLLIDFKFLAARWDLLLLLVLAVTVAKTIVNIGILALLREPWPHAFIAGVLLAQIGEFSLVISGAAERGGIISRDLGQTIVAVMAISLLLSPLWLFTTRRLLRVVILGMTSFHDTIAAIRSRRLAAVWHVTAAGFGFAAYAAMRVARGTARGIGWAGRGVGRLFVRRPRDDEARPTDYTLTPRGVADPDDAPETPRYPPPDGPAPDARPLSGPTPTAPPAPEPPPSPPASPPPSSPQSEAPLRPRTTAEAAEIIEGQTIPRREAPSAALRRMPTGPAPETPRYPAPDGAPHDGVPIANAPPAQKKPE